MPIDSPRREFSAALPVWQMCRDCYEGARAVKARSTAYLPALNTVDDPTIVLQQLGVNQQASGTGYSGYLMRAPFYNATRRTVQGLTGMVFRKAPNVEGVPARFEEHLDDLTLTKQSFEQVAIDIFNEQGLVGRVGVLLDMPPDGGERPYWVFYNAEQITWWKTERRGGDQLLTDVVLRETVEVPDGADPFLLKEVVQYRHVRLVDNACTVTEYRQAEGGQKNWVATGPDVILRRRGVALDFIPFLVFGAQYIGPEIDTAPMLDLVEENLSHFRSSADLEHGLHWTALPTPWIAAQNTQAVMTIGSSQAWNLGPDGKAGMLEFTGTGLGAIAARIEKKEHHMAVLGARLLESEPTTQETASAVRLRHSGEGSVLRRMASTLEQGLQTLLRWHLWWAGMGTALDSPELLKVMVGVNKEFMEERLSPTEAKDLILSWQSDGFSYDTLFYNLQRGNMVPPGRTLEEEMALIQSQVNQRMLPEPAIPELDGEA